MFLGEGLVMKTTLVWRSEAGFFCFGKAGEITRSVTLANAQWSLPRRLASASCSACVDHLARGSLTSITYTQLYVFVM
jgi:hypothetical protein